MDKNLKIWPLYFMVLSAPLIADEQPYVPPCFSPIVSLEALYLTPREDGLEFAVTNHEEHRREHSTIADAGPGDRAKVHHVDFDWDFGFRLGFGGQLPRHDAWNLFLTWTWFRQNDEQSVHESNDTVILVPWIAPRSLLAYTKKAKSHFKIQYNTFDFDIGRTFKIARTVELVPHIGVRAAWIDQDFKIRYDGLSIHVRDLPICDSNVNLQNDFKGAGLRAGLGSKWYFANHWNIYGDLSAALVYGTFEIQDKEKFSNFKEDHFEENFDFSPFVGPLHDIKDHFQSTAVNLDFLAGFAWEYPFHCDKLLTVNLGYEFHLWLNQNQFEKFSSGHGGYTLLQDGGDLSLSGVALGLRCKF